MPSFDELWKEITERTGVVTVQERSELEHVFNLMRGCSSYLEVGTAEGNSLFVLSQALEPNSRISYIDFGEKHTETPRKEVIGKLSAAGREVIGIHGDSNDKKTLNRLGDQSFDVVLIDAGHDDFNVAIDAMFYGPLAKKYIIFHDVMLPDVSRAFEWYRRQRSECESYRFVNSETFGYGILKI